MNVGLTATNFQWCDTWEQLWARWTRCYCLLLFLCARAGLYDVWRCLCAHVCVYDGVWQHVRGEGVEVGVGGLAGQCRVGAGEGLEVWQKTESGRIEACNDSRRSWLEHWAAVLWPTLSPPPQPPCVRVCGWQPYGPQLTRLLKWPATTNKKLKPRKKEKNKTTELPDTRKVLYLHTTCCLPDQVLQKCHNRVRMNFQITTL